VNINKATLKWELFPEVGSILNKFMKGLVYGQGGNLTLSWKMVPTIISLPAAVRGSWDPLEQNYNEGILSYFRF
jgi:hypothetical protein